MKEQIVKIAKDLEQGTITEPEAQNLLLGLFGVSNMLPDAVIKYNNCLRLKKELDDNIPNGFVLDINSFLIGANWVTDYVKGNYY